MSRAKRPAHNAVRDRIAQEYFRLPLLNCRFCKYETPLPTEGVSQVVTEHEHGQFRADVAALNRQGKVVAVVEVVNTNPPSEQVLAAQSELAGAFYIELDELDNGFTGYCSPAGRTGTRRTCHIGAFQLAPARRPYHRWNSHTSSWIGRTPTTPVCIECAARTSGGQWRSPGGLALGDPQDPRPGRRCARPVPVVLRLGLLGDGLDQQNLKAWVGAISRDGDFGSPRPDGCRVQCRRLERRREAPPTHRRASMGQTVRSRIVRVEPRQLRADSSRLASLERVSTQLPPAFGPSRNQVASAAGRRGDRYGSDIPNPQGLPDGKFTACGIDRENSDEPIEATMTGNPTWTHVDGVRKIASADTGSTRDTWE